MGIKRFWDYISTHKIPEDLTGLEYIKARVLNQYTFLLFFFFFLDAFRDLAFGYIFNFVLLFTLGLICLLVFFFSSLRFKDVVVFMTVLLCCGLVFVFSTLDGFKNGISYYYSPYYWPPYFFLTNVKTTITA